MHIVKLFQIKLIKICIQELQINCKSLCKHFLHDYKAPLGIYEKNKMRC